MIDLTSAEEGRVLETWSSLIVGASFIVGCIHRLARVLDFVIYV